MAIPTVTAKDLHTVQLSPQLRKLLHKRAAAAERRAYAPILAADRSAFGAANRTYGREKGAAEGATSAVESTLTDALAGLKTSGLSGKYLHQAAGELSARQGSATDALPYLLAEASQNRNSELGEARQQLVGDRAQMLSGIASQFNSALESERDKGSTILKEREGRVRSKREAEAQEAKEATEKATEPGEAKFDSTNLENAKLAIKNALQKWSANPTVETPDGEELPLKEYKPLKSQKDWEEFGVEVASEYPGFGLAEVNAVIQHYLNNKPRREHEGRVRQPGVPGPGLPG